MDVVFLILTTLLGGLFFLCFFRAAKFAKRHEAQLTGILEKSSWWIRLFAKNGYGPESERERKTLALQWLTVGALFFIVAGSAQLIYAP